MGNEAPVTPAQGSPSAEVTPAATPVETPAATPAATTETPNTPAGGITDPAQPKTPPAAETPPAKTIVTSEPNTQKYELKLQDGSVYDQTHVERLVQSAKEKNLSPEQAKWVLERDHSIAKAFEESDRLADQKRRTEWYSQSQADPEFGGLEFEKNAALAKTFVEQHTTEGFRALLHDTGLTNHPEVVRHFYRQALKAQPDSMVLTGTQPPPKKSREEIFYGKAKP